MKNGALIPTLFTQKYRRVFTLTPNMQICDPEYGRVIRTLYFLRGYAPKDEK